MLKTLFDRLFAYNKLPETEAVMRLQAVKRWHMVETTRTQTLAEHSANVALLAWSIARTSPGGYLSSANVVIIALVHDLGEAFLGDIPTPSKLRLGRDLINEAELATLPSLYSLTLKAATPTELLLIKLCDLADGIRFIRVHKVDGVGKWAQAGLEEQFSLRKVQARTEWPKEVFEHVLERVTFYAYEEA